METNRMLALLALDLGDIDMELTDGIRLKPFRVRLFALGIRETGNAEALQATV